MFNDDLKRRVRDATNILDLVQSAVGKLTRAGRNYKGCCPFHNEKTPSFNVNPEGGFFKCFGCGKSGDVFTFIMLKERVEFPEALKMLADRAGIAFESDPRAAALYQKEKDWKSYLYKLNDSAAAFFREQLYAPAGKHALAYLGKRGLNREICERFGLGYAPAGGSPLLAKLRAQKAPTPAILLAGLASEKDGGSVRDFFFDRLMFPIRDAQKRVIAFGGRILGDGEPKYLNTRETPLFSKTKTVYGIDLARESIGSSRRAVLVEGYTDVMMCHQFGVENVVACLGTAVTPEHIRQLRHHADEVVMLTDSDNAGARASERSLAVLFAEELPAKIARLPGGDKDPCDFLLSKGKEAFIAALEKSVELFDYKFERTLQTHDIRSPLGLKNAAEELMTLASLVPNTVVRNEFRRRISARLNISEKELKFDVRPAPAIPTEAVGGAASASGPGPGVESGATPAPETALARAERELLQFLFHEPAWMTDAVAQLDLLAFTGACENAVARALLMAMSEGKLPPEPSLLADGNASSIVAREVMGKFYELQASGVALPNGAEQVCVELAGVVLAGLKLDARSRFEMLLKPVKFALLNDRLLALKRETAHCRQQGNVAGVDAAYERMSVVLKELAMLKSGLNRI